VPERERRTDAERRGPSRLPYAVATTLMATLVVAAWVGRGRFRPVIAGERAPDFAAWTLDGERVALSDYEGKVLLVNVWATWCPPCRGEMPSMEALYREIGDERFEILAVSVDPGLGQVDPGGRKGVSSGDLAAFADELDLTFPILHDPGGDIQRIYQTVGVPESFIIGTDGVIARKLAGATVWDHPNYRALIHRLLAQ